MSAFPPPSSAFPPRVAVIGGGISGLAAAHRLAERLPRAEIELFEAATRLGGVIHTVERDGFLIEQAADNFLVKPPAGIELCRSLGIADDLIATDDSRRRAFVVRRGRLVPVPDGFYLMSPRKIWPLLTSPALSLVGKLRLLAEPLIPPRLNLESSPNELSGDESVADFARRRLGTEVFEQFVQPLVAGIYTADPERLSMAATLPQFLEYERSQGSVLRGTLRHTHNLNEGASGARYGLFVAPRHGMTSLIQTLANRLGQVNVYLNAPVAAVHRQSDGWHLDFGTQGVPGDLESGLKGTLRNPQSPFHALIVALPAPAAARLFQNSYPQLAKELSAIEYAGCAVVSLGFARSQIGHPLDGFGFVVPQTERRRIIAGSFASLKFPGRASGENVLIRAFLGGALQTELLSLNDNELSRIAREELSSLLQISGEPRVVDVARWPQSMPQYCVGHLARVDRIESYAARRPNFALAGNAYRGVGIPQCIASGQAASERIAANFNCESNRLRSAE